MPLSQRDDLGQTLAVGSREDSGDLDSTSLEIDDDENEIPNQARPGDHFDVKEVSYRDTRKRCFLPYTGP